MPDLTPDQMQKIRELVHERKMIDAIRKYRIMTGVGLAEAKEVIGVIFHNDPLGSPLPITPQTTTNNPVLDKNIRDSFKKNDKAGAIKLYMETCGGGLRKAKDFVDLIETSMRNTYKAE